jgi:glycyl-tRNA synthetase (class II)
LASSWYTDLQCPSGNASGATAYAFISVTSLSGCSRGSTTSADTKKARTTIFLQSIVSLYVSVISPNMFNAKLWETSGHWQNYKDDMFMLDVEKEKWALKPMNCPGHCLIFDSRDRSYKELPIRMAEFGIIHRNEASGALTGLTRVRRFVQDDTHVFCMPDQVCYFHTTPLTSFSKHVSRSRKKFTLCSISCNILMVSLASNSLWSFLLVRRSILAPSKLGMPQNRFGSNLALTS